MIRAPKPFRKSPAEAAITRPRERWNMGDHRLICGDSKDAAVYAALLGDERVRLVVSDSPYNVPVQGHVSGLGSVQHREFAEGSGEMTDPQFTDFLATVMQRSAVPLLDGGLGYWFMDAAHIPNLHAAASRASLEYKQTTVWAKNNAGMGAFYRVQTEFVVIVKKRPRSPRQQLRLGRPRPLPDYPLVLPRHEFLWPGPR